MNHKRILVFAAISAALLTSCTKELTGLQGIDAPTGGHLEITAGYEGTKSVVNGFRMYWAKTDTLIVYDAEGNGTKFSTADDYSETATFKTDNWPGGQPAFAACCNPGYKEPYVLNSPSPGVMTVKFREEQKVLWTGTCARQASASVGKVEYSDGGWSVSEMKNVMGFLCVRITGAGVKKVVAEAIGGENMAGWVDVDYNKIINGDSAFWVPTAGKSQSSKVTLSCSDNAADAGCFKVATYYLSVLPQTYAKGIRFTLYDAAGAAVLERTIGKSGGVTVRRGEIRTLNQGLDDTLPATITIDLPFYNEQNTNPLGFGALEAADENPKTGEEYNYTYSYSGKSIDLPITVCRGSAAGTRYLYNEYTLVYPQGVRGKCLVFEKNGGWIKVPAIQGHFLQSITYEHGNGYVKQMVVKESLDPSVSIAYTSDKPHQIATEQGPNSETISFYSNTTMTTNVTANPKENTPYYLQFITQGGTRVYRIKLTYTSTLPAAPTFPEQESSFPKVRIVTDGKDPIVSKEDYVSGSIWYEDANGIHPGARSVSEEKTARFKGRGNTTWKMPKKPYRIKLNGKASFFDLGKDKDWCLLANYSDKSLLRNVVAMEISRKLGMSWTPTMYPVELWLNDAYQGLYTLSEHKKVGKNRINITLPEDGGKDMYLETDLLMDETTCFKTGMGIPVMYCDPEIPSDEMLNETKQWFADFEASLSSENFPSSGYEQYIDVNSFIDHYIIQELSKNVDGRMTKGAFFTRSVGGPLKIYHEWDFDIAFGNDYALSTLGHGVDAGPTGFLIKDFTGPDYGQGWYPTLFKDPAFVQKVKDRWNSVYPELCKIPSYIDEKAAQLGETADRNFTRWPILGIYVWPNTSWPATYAEEVQNLKDFYTQRLAWLNTNLNKL